MKALVLCAGFGQRLGELTANCPKPLLSLGQETIVEHILRQLVRASITDVYINLHYLAPQFPAHLGDGERFGLRLHYLHERAPKGTAGTPRDLAAEIANDALLVHYGDIVTNHDLSELAHAHRDLTAEATILVHQRPGSNSYAYFADDGQHIERFVERPATSPDPTRPSWAFSGVCVLCAGLLRRLSPAPVLDLPRDVFPGVAKARRLAGQPLRGYRWAIDSPERLAMARRALAPGSPYERERSR
ncbi:MAG: nucleotidyltransferase family protein [Myxococcales bacterium FL481]|nr:MAG: nucleotidyltransferase family protein [Myxococcales bacterium FL481]